MTNHIYGNTIGGISKLTGKEKNIGRIKFSSFLLKSLSKRLHYKNAYVIIATY